MNLSTEPDYWNMVEYDLEPDDEPLLAQLREKIKAIRDSDDEVDEKQITPSSFEKIVDSFEKQWFELFHGEQDILMLLANTHPAKEEQGSGLRKKASKVSLLSFVSHLIVHLLNHISLENGIARITNEVLSRQTTENQILHNGRKKETNHKAIAEHKILRFFVQQPREEQRVQSWAFAVISPKLFIV